MTSVQIPPTNLELLREDVDRQAAILQQMAPDLRAQAERVAGVLPRPSRVYLTGCGDSLNAGMATRLTWEEMLGVPVEAIPAMTFSRYAVDTAPEDAWVIALSQSGTVTRVVEAVRAARERGLTTVTVTGRDDSPLGLEPSTARFTLSFPKLGFVPGTTSYAVGLLAFLELAMAYAPDLPRTAALREAIERLPGIVDATVKACRPVAERHAEVFEPDSLALLLGAGPHLATCQFTARKLYEVPQIVALAQETEEYAHDSYSIVGPRTLTMLYAPPDRGWGRAVEILAGLRHLGSHVALITDAGQPVEGVDLVYPIAPLDLALSPILYAIPSEMLCYTVARRLGGSFYATADPMHASDGDTQIYASAIEV
jgi:glutamine---fructose-6-phosphate transaminase (isomerizing)